MAILTPSRNNGSSQSKQKVIVGLDIGTSKFCCLVASPDEKTKKLDILGIGISEAEGLFRGVVVKIDNTVKTIQKVIAEAEQQSGLQIKEVIVGIAGDHIESYQSRGIVGISNINKEVSENDVERLLEESCKIAIPSDRRILHVIPQDYIIDGQDGIIDPIGMSGVRMEANVHIVTGLITAIQNIYKCVERSGIRVKDIVLEPLASSHAVLDSDEKEVGVALIDIGGGTTDIAIFEEGIVRFTSGFGIAGKQVTYDIKTGLGIIPSQAEKIKREYGHAYMNNIMHDDLFMVPGIGGRKPMEITKSYLCRIIQPRYEEIFEFALSEIRRSGYSGRLGAGIVLTGGSALVGGIEELAQEVFGMPVKIGIPSGVTYSGLVQEVENPMYSTAVGLVLHELKGMARDSAPDDDDEPLQSEKKNKMSFFKKVRNYLEEL
ncbi:MAG: cell division protein FtsA [Ignavibacteria bacterium GWB2_35_12]|nr:MAG: cell division protein FtsA [Ignavibacteria bacterium GWA2_35_8]OGU41845.1 MAG: cell division protein FtsA [Ignavibacteria bacterium GWB2_35_12]OGU86069.1 MAG: cell division protein FtsA [Ignavibacteria bacterium RIFOXYA2_FULL_35_10]OGV23507.1 MAG: cell division protein FtsA [Ignavibacteria bacterium RIFOXYC2_FULL_35_21]